MDRLTLKEYHDLCGVKRKYSSTREMDIFARGQRINEKFAVWRKIANYVRSEPLPSEASPTSSQNSLPTHSNLM